MVEVPNPWSPENWNLTRQGDYIKKYGLSVAQRKASQAGTTIGALEPKPKTRANYTVIVQRRNIISGGGGGGGSGSGSSGNGPPT